MDYFRKNKKDAAGEKGTDELLYIDLPILKEAKMRWENVAMSWIDYKKAYDTILQT